MYAAIVEILLICVLRRGNVARLRLDDLHRPDPRTGRITHIRVPPHEAKNGKAIEWPFPPESAKILEKYIRRYRPRQAAEGNPFLFPGSGNRPRHPQGIASWVSRTVARDIGVEFHMHLARHFAGWNFLRRYPGQYEVVRQALGHDDVKTTTTYYLGLEADAAAQHCDSVVLEDRRATRKIAAQAFRKGRGGLARSKSGKGTVPCNKGRGKSDSGSSGR
jgi:integrase